MWLCVEYEKKPSKPINRGGKACLGLGMGKFQPQRTRRCRAWRPHVPCYLPRYKQPPGACRVQRNTLKKDREGRGLWFASGRCAPKAPAFGLIPSFEGSGAFRRQNLPCRRKPLGTKTLKVFPTPFSDPAHAAYWSLTLWLCEQAQHMGPCHKRHHDFPGVMGMWQRGNLKRICSGSKPVVCSILMGRSEQQELEAAGSVLSTVKKQKGVEVRDLATGCTTPRLDSDPQDPMHHPTLLPSSSSPWPSLPYNSNRFYWHRSSPHKLEEQTI